MQTTPSAFRLLISEEKIQQEIQVLAGTLNQQFVGKNVTIVAVMKGAICFTADLIRKLTFPFSLELLTCQSYGMRGKDRGKLSMESLPPNIKDSHILLLDDMFDSGNTLFTVYKKIMTFEPASCTSVVLLLKNMHREISYLPDFAVFTIENDFVIGYGMDLKEEYRGLPGIYIDNE